MSRLLREVQKYVELKPHKRFIWFGEVNSYSGLCPFHDEKTPSFLVRNKTNYWICLSGCGGGGLSSFIEKIGEKK